MLLRIQGGIIVNTKSFAIGLILGFILIFSLLFLSGYDWVGVIVVIIVFYAIKERLNLDAFSFWYGEIIALLAIDAWIFYILYTANIALVDVIVYFIPALGMSVIALLYFGRKKRQIQI